MRPKKALGQNFLSDHNYRRKIAASLDLKATDRILEIGPGQGALTELIAGHCTELIVVEKDAELAPKLAERFVTQIKIINDDFLDVDLGDLLQPGGAFKTVGNLPYNAASPILIRLLENHACFSDLFLMFQKEVALRFVAKPGTRDYGLPTLWATVYSECRILFHLPPTVFFPKPKVHSSFVHFKIRPQPLVDAKLAPTFWNMARTLFQHRRKTASATLKEAGWSADKIGRLNLEKNARVETMSVADLIGMARSVADC